MSKIKLKDISVKISKGATPTSITNYECNKEDVPFIRVGDIRSFRLSRTEYTLSLKTINNDKLKILQRGTIIISIEGTIGKVAILDKEMCMNQAIAYIELNKDVYIEYIAYFLKIYLKNYLGVGSTRPAIRLANISQIEISLPPLEEQKKIADLLSSIDTKIELNNKINKDLEEVAKALYTKWFVNFDFPNNEGKPYKSSGGEMIESELGMIPVGWEVGKLGDVIDFANGFPFKTNSYEENGEYRVITIKNVMQNEFNLLKNDSKIKKIPSKIKEDQILKIGDILISLTGDVGRICIVDRGNCLLNQRVGKIILKNNCNYAYVLYLFLSKSIKSKIAGISTGSIQQNVSTNNILNLLNIIPNNELIENFNEKISPLITQFISNNSENQQLKEIRDLLLPYLMSGKITVE